MVVAAVSLLAAVADARAETATFIEPDVMSERDRLALSTRGDNSGFLLGLGQSLALVFDTPLSLERGDRISVFSLRPQTGGARAQIRFGAYNNGSPIILASRNFNAGQNRNIRVNNGLLSGCQLLGGCDYIEIITTRVRGGASGAEIDYVLVDGEVVQVASPSPEPKTWAMMIIAFAACAARLKSLRRARPKPRAASPPGWRNLPWRGPGAPRTVHP